MDEICVQGAAESRKKTIYYSVYRIEDNKSRRAHSGLVEFKRRIDNVRLEVQAQYEELCESDREESCPNCGVERMRIQTRPMQPFWETIRNAPPGPGGRRPKSTSEEVRAVRRVEEMNEGIRTILEERRRYQLKGIRGFSDPLPRSIGLLNVDVGEGRTVWALSSPFLDPLYGRDIVSPCLVPHHLQ